MPYVLISTQIRMEVGPTMVGDEYSDPELMEHLGASKRGVLGNNFYEYYVSDPPRIVLDKGTPSLSGCLWAVNGL
uniref:GTP cyclohydrolase 1 feedback regulatory protein n=1 Tax=Myotis myotis TaxID=51298 RepID=A0A7J8AJS8_MYOMY|nr:GTP cyclohydrolase I feedback regulator [Myotis myotis]